ncbi:hypothetical protein KFE25_011584 [Diacronema lutheri]|uniref:Uncharacterized protein n=2 Tax=Diacronema lutheri TaxID=2081491 RepID=A0A8J5XD17_DIALT|nr:hypothetical protein KFE25_011584 [Diacronema lutheri]
MLGTVIAESVFTAILVGFFSVMGLLPWPNATSANIAAVVFLRLLGVTLDRLQAGVHLSPAVTIMLTTSGRVPAGECVQRLIGQLVGAPFLLLFVLHTLAGKTTLGDLGLPIPSGGAPWIVAIEGAATFCLLMLIFKSGSSLAADVGGTVIGGVLCPRLSFAASMNPAMTTFAALVTGTSTATSLALVGSLTAGVAFGLMDRQGPSKLKQA